MTEFKGTRGPWVYDENENKIYGDWDFKNDRGATGKRITDDQGRFINDEDREFLVHAVNAHNALIAALEKASLAIHRQTQNIDNWLETGQAATPEESESIYNQMKTACIEIEKALNNEKGE